MASRQKIYSDPLLVEITWQTKTQPYEFGSKKMRKHEDNAAGIATNDADRNRTGRSA